MLTAVVGRPAPNEAKTRRKVLASEGNQDHLFTCPSSFPRGCAGTSSHSPRGGPNRNTPRSTTRSKFRRVNTKKRASNNFPFFPPIPNGCPFTILWGFVACQLLGGPSCLSRGTAASLFRRWSIGPNWKFERKARGLRKGTEKKISQPRMKHGWNTDKKEGQLPQPRNLVVMRGS